MIIWCKSSGKELSILLMNLISVEHLDPYQYHNWLDRYKVGTLYCSSKDLDNIEIYLTLINQISGLSNQKITTDQGVESSVAEKYIYKTPKPP